MTHNIHDRAKAKTVALSTVWIGDCIGYVNSDGVITTGLCTAIQSVGDSNTWTVGNEVLRDPDMEVSLLVLQVAWQLRG